MVNWQVLIIDEKLLMLYWDSSPLENSIEMSITFVFFLEQSERHIVNSLDAVKGSYSGIMYRRRFQVFEDFRVEWKFFQKLEGRVSSDTDLKLVDLLKYISAETSAGAELMYRRTRALADYESANKALDRAKLKQTPSQPDRTATVSRHSSSHSPKSTKITKTYALVVQMAVESRTSLYAASWMDLIN